MRIVLDTDRALAERVLDIQRAAYGVEASLVGHELMPPRHETLAELRSQPLIFLAAGIDHVLAGVLGYSRADAVVDIDRVAVDPPYFRRGVATKLLRELFVRERDADIMSVSIAVGNAPAMALCARTGFVVVGAAQPVPGGSTVRLERRSSRPARS